jgi:hypothetical protein
MDSIIMTLFGPLLLEFFSELSIKFICCWPDILTCHTPCNIQIKPKNCSVTTGRKELLLSNRWLGSTTISYGERYGGGQGGRGMRYMSDTNSIG